MKKILMTLAFAIFATCCLTAKPLFKSVSSLNGKTTVEITIPAKDRDSNGAIALEDIILKADGLEYKSQRVSNRTMRESSTFKIQFDHVPDLSSAVMEFRLNGKPCRIDIGKELR